MNNAFRNKLLSMSTSFSVQDVIYGKLKSKVDSGEFEIESNTQVVTDPFRDETLRFEVDPIEHYGLEKILEAIK